MENENKYMMNVKKKDILKYVHILLIIIGTLFMILPNFFESLWFDESYSVAISRHSINEIWSIGSNDVHPIFYYIIIHFIGIITNNSILSFRLFSCIALVIIAILGYTHIRKDFGEKVGLVFSFLILFMPVNLAYAGEIRMYTVAMLFVTVMAIYAYRIYKSGISTKNWIIFSIFSLLSAYTHYYALAVAFIINIALFVYFLVNCIKQKNYEVKYSKYPANLKRSIVSAIFQIIFYLPWLGTLVSLAIGSSENGFWIGAPNFIQIFEFQFTGNLDMCYIERPFSYIFAGIMLIYLIILLIKYWRDAKPAKIALSIYIITIILIGILSILTTPILYARYFLIITSLLLFAYAYLIAKDLDSKICYCICLIIIVSACITNIALIKINYDNSNKLPINYVQANIEDDDIILIDNRGSGFVISQYFPNNKLYFWDIENWNVDEAYKAFGNTIHNLDSLQNYKGRIWIISDNSNTLNRVIENLGIDNIQVLDNQFFDTKYKLYRYDISLIQKNS